jgi:hypothetical protein
MNLFDEKEGYTKTASEINERTSKFAKEMIDKYRKKGCKIREIAHIMYMSISESTDVSFPHQM